MQFHLVKISELFNETLRDSNKSVENSCGCVAPKDGPYVIRTEKMYALKLRLLKNMMFKTLELFQCKINFHFM